ncbi:MAG: hypothetical protein PHO15_10190 [Eubacteriales bacterium]|nr:hypothetical protein [Eubacteriales bacterium]
MKYEWRKQDAALYLPKAQPTVVNVGEYPYLTLTAGAIPTRSRFPNRWAPCTRCRTLLKCCPKERSRPKDTMNTRCFLWRACGISPTRQGGRAAR